jgi:hypothetical protein
MSTNPNAATAITFKPVNGSVAPLEAAACDGVGFVAPEGWGVAELGVCEAGVVAAGVVAAGVVAAGVVADARTITVPCMNGWIWQKYV